MQAGNLQPTIHLTAVVLTVGDDLIIARHHVAACGAIAARLAGTGGGQYQVVQFNEAYGTGESPLIQQNGDPVSDQLYTSGLALPGAPRSGCCNW